jgi:pimeloyl-ACP methyl ester carboxylesterase
MSRLLQQRIPQLLFRLSFSRQPATHDASAHCEKLLSSAARSPPILPRFDLKIIFRMRNAFCLLFLTLVLSGCASNYGAFIADAALDPPDVETMQAASGETLQLYHVDTAPDPKGTIFFISGSGCHSLRYYLRQYFAALPGSWRIFAVQKAGVDPFSTGFTCSREFETRAALPEILSRNREALDVVASRRGKVDALFGVSEGGGLAVALAADNPKIPRLVVIGSGGLTMREDLGLLARTPGFPIGSQELQSKFADIASDPQSVDKRLLGLPYLYWSSSLDKDPMPFYLRVSQPAKVFFGEQDQSVPVESARALRDRLNAAHRTNIEVEIVEGASHTLVRDGKDLKPEIFRRLDAWLTAG